VPHAVQHHINPSDQCDPGAFLAAPHRLSDRPGLESARRAAAQHRIHGLIQRRAQGGIPGLRDLADNTPLTGLAMPQGHANPRPISLDERKRLTTPASTTELIHTAAHALIPLAILMPVMGGLYALRLMRAESAKSDLLMLVAIATTANVMTDQVAFFKLEGFFETLAKPLRQIHLEASLIRALAAADCYVAGCDAVHTRSDRWPFSQCTNGSLTCGDLWRRAARKMQGSGTACAGGYSTALHFNPVGSDDLPRCNRRQHADQRPALRRQVCAVHHL